MAKPLRISVWNANGLCKHAQEIPPFIQIFDIDILLVSETRFTYRSYMKVPNYTRDLQKVSALLYFRGKR